MIPMGIGLRLDFRPTKRRQLVRLELHPDRVMKSYKEIKPANRSHNSRATLIAFLALLCASCASQYVNGFTEISQYTGAVSMLTADACRSALKKNIVESEFELDAENIRIVTWNVHKQAAKNWKHDYDKLAINRDLVLFQEVSLRKESINNIDASKYWSFAPGFRSRGEISGVLTLSSVKPLTQCSFVNVEPLLRTPKATSITQYGLTETDETLVVVNIHAINFTLGMGAYRKQVNQVVESISQHRGPMIISGDFNTWSAKRGEFVNEIAENLKLTAIHYSEDHRTRIMGKVMDHIYIRGLAATHAETRKVATSDHNPMSVTLSM